jgi:hypothetical protein
MRQVSSRITRFVAVLLFLAITSQAVAAPVQRDRDRLSVRDYIKRLILKAFSHDHDQLGCPPGCTG